MGRSGGRARGIARVVRGRAGAARQVVGIGCLVAVAAACGTGGPGSGSSPDASLPSIAVSPSPTGSRDPRTVVCARLDHLNQQLAALEAVALRVAERATLDDRWEEVNAAFLDLDEEDWQALGETMDGPMEQLGYRLRDVGLGVEDFRTSPNPAKAAKHVQAATAAFTLAIYDVQVAAACPLGTS